MNYILFWIKKTVIVHLSGDSNHKKNVNRHLLIINKIRFPKTFDLY